MKTLGPDKNFLGLDRDHSSLDAAAAVILPAPFEATVTSGQGTRNGPAAILKASHQVEFFDEATGREFGLERGIATLPPVAFGRKHSEPALDLVHTIATDMLRRQKFLMTLGGEHTITSALAAAHGRVYPNLSILQLDAHADLRPSYLDNPYSHASVMARVAEFIDPERIVQVGVRSLSKEEAEFIRDKKVHTYFAHRIREKYAGLLKRWMDDAVDKLTNEVYLTVDVDCFDPAIMPSTGTPEPNGLKWQEVMDLIRLVARKRKIVGADVVEFSPIAGLHHPDLTAARLVYRILNFAL